MKQEYKCAVSGQIIPKARVEALRFLGTPEDRWTCVEYSRVKPKQGIFLGESGTSQLLMVERVYNDSVREVFKTASSIEETDHYKPEDIEYYAGNESEKTESEADVLSKATE